MPANGHFQPAAPEEFQLPPLPLHRGWPEAEVGLLLKVCLAPELRPLASGVELAWAPERETPFAITGPDAISLGPAALASRQRTALALRHALELCLWLRIMGPAPGPEAVAAASLLACRAAAVYISTRLKQEQRLMREGMPGWLRSGLDRLGPLTEPPKDEAWAWELAAQLAAWHGPDSSPAAPTLQALGFLAQAWPVAAPSEHLLTLGGDTRLGIDPQSGLNAYGCSPRPRSWAVTFASSTASSISDLAFVRAEASRQRLMRAAWEGGFNAAFSQEVEAVRRAVGERWSSVAGTETILCTSGTDAELAALYLSLAKDERPLVNLLVAPEETGGGVLLAASGLNFAETAPSGQALVKGEPLPGLPMERISLQTLPVRGPDARIIPNAELDAEVERLIAKAVDKGARVLLHLVDASKTGISVPSLACVDRLQERWPDRVDVAVDACQLRLSPKSLSAYLARGCLVMITGSKFYTGPPFCGALLVPPKIAARVGPDQPAPEALAPFISRHEWPPAWQNAAGALGDWQNLGLLLRWRAALWEMRAFAATSRDDRLKILSSFGWRILSAILQNPDLRLVSFPVPPRAAPGQLAGWDQLPTIFTFAPLRPLDGGKRLPLSMDQARRVYQWLNTDISACLPGGAPSQERELAQRRFHLGQPVMMIGRGGEEVGALRLSAGARLVSGVAFEPALGPDPPSRLASETSDALGALSKISLIMRYFAEICQSPAPGPGPDQLHLI